MCGISGYIGKKTLDTSIIDNTLKIMNNRGPDYQSWEVSKNLQTNIYLIHSRLSIIDLENRSNQPFIIDDYILIFNGEIYNYLEIRKDLIKKGHKFATNSDTEVLLKAYIEYGSDCLKYFNGMWAFVLWDNKEKKLIMSRDRFGEKPLYFYQNKEGFYFGSEIKFIFSLLNKKLPINYDHCYRFLINGYKSIHKVKENFFRDIRQVSPGTFVIVNSSNQKINTHNYWKPSFNQNFSLKYDFIIEKTRELLIKAVELRLRSDVPIAFCMSGGVDSNSIIGIAKKILGYEVHGFTIINEDERYNEKNNVNQVVKRSRLKHTEIPINTNNFLSKLRKLILYHDAPVATISNYANWLLQENIANAGYQISISGAGADEIFTGYFDHHLFYFSDIQNDNSLLKKSICNWEKFILPGIRNPFLRNSKTILNNSSFRNHIFLNSQEFLKYLKKDWFENFKEKKYCKDLLRNRMANEVFHEVIPVILHEDDLNSMYFSIENRTPFLDHNLFEFCQTIPTKYLIRDGYAKIILREAMKDIIPNEIIYSHKKIGFNAPIFSFLDVEDENVKSYLLDQSLIFDHVDRNKIENILKKPDLSNSYSKFLFNFINLKIFIEEFA